jgi:hypothetical protein
MRGAALLLLCVSCSGPELELQVTVSPSQVHVGEIDARCDCRPRNGCWDYSDIIGPDHDECECEAIYCIDTVIVRKDDRVGSLRIGDPGPWAFAGDWAGGELIIEGCGGRAQLDVPVTFPRKPEIVNAGHGAGVTHIAWDIDDLTTTVSVGTGGGFAGTVCRFDRSTRSHDFRGMLDLDRFQIAGWIELPLIPTDAGPVRVRATP